MTIRMNGSANSKIHRFATTACAALILAACGGGSDGGETNAGSGPGAEDAAVVTQPIDVNAAPSGENVPIGQQEVTGGDEVDLSDAEAPGTAPLNEIKENRAVAISGASLPPYDSTVADDGIGLVAPTLVGASFDGTEIVVGGGKDNPTMIVFLAHWCPHCNDEIPVLIGLDEAGSIPSELDIVGVSTAVDSTRVNFPPSEWTAEVGWPWPMVADDDVLSAIGAMGGTSFPFTVILDTDGTVLARRGGSASAEQTLEFINTALG